MRASSAFSMNGFVTSRKAAAAASIAATRATRVLLRSCTARYRTEMTTAIEPTNCDTALTASQFIPALKLGTEQFGVEDFDYRRPWTDFVFPSHGPLRQA